MANPQQFDILSVGDVATDVFIKLFDDEARIVKDAKDQEWLAMLYATKTPFDHAEVIDAVGNAANAAMSFARLGLKTGYVTNVGTDQRGRDVIENLGKNDVDTRFVRVNPHKVTNCHYILWYKDDRTILINHEEYDYHWPHLRPSEIPRWIYFSSVSKHALDYHDDIADWLEVNPSVYLAFQPGTFQMEAGAHRLKRLYKRTAVLILNREEAAFVGGGKHEDMHDLLDKLHDLGPQVVVVTDGPDGAYASDGRQRLTMPVYPDIAKPYERTGAGDAFASTFVACAAKGMSLEEALLRAPINSMSVVQKTGGHAGLLTDHQIEEYLKKAPKNYKPRSF